MAVSNIRKNDIPVVDMFDSEGERKAIASGVTGLGRATAIKSVSQTLIGVGWNRQLKSGEQASALAADSGITAGQVTKWLAPARVADLHVNGADKASEGLANYDADKVEQQRQRIMRYWECEFQGVEDAPKFTETMAALIGDDGEARRPALGTVYSVFGGPSTFYNIANGDKLHVNDPANVPDESEGESEGDDDESGEDEKVSWQDRLSALVKQAVVEGASTSDILGVVNAALKS